MEVSSNQGCTTELEKHLRQLSQFFKLWIEQQELLIQTVSAPSMRASKSYDQISQESCLEGASGIACGVQRGAPGVTVSPSQLTPSSNEELQVEDRLNRTPVGLQVQSMLSEPQSATGSSCVESSLSSPFANRVVHLVSKVSQSVTLPKNWLWETSSKSVRSSKSSRRDSSKMVVESLMKTKGQDFEHHRLFTTLSCFVILYNSAIIAADSDHTMANPKAPDSFTFFKYSELACAIYYMVELAIRLYVERMMFWKGLDWRWNVFDVCLVFQAAVDQAGQWSGWNIMGDLSNLSFFRLLRLFKTLRVLRFIRLMRVFRELRLILSSLFGCVTSFLWACTLLAAVCFMASIAIMQSCSSHLFHRFDEEDNFEVQIILKYWSSVAESMLTLVTASFGGIDWTEISDPLRKVSVPAYTVFVLFQGVFTFVILNIVNSIFIETMMDTASRDSHMIIGEMMDQKQEYIEQLKAVFEAIDENGDGELSYQEFCTLSTSAALRAFVYSLGIDMSDAKHFFRVLSAGGKRPVDIQCFVDGSIKMRGVARSMDLLDLVYQHKLAVFEHKSTLKVLQGRMDEMVRECMLLSTRLQESMSQAKSKHPRDAFAKIAHMSL